MALTADQAGPEQNAVTWVLLSDATTIMDHDVERARGSLGRAISKAWLVSPGGLPKPTTDPNVPLRIQVMPSPGWRLPGRAWLDQPVLHWETSEIECLCAQWAPPRQLQLSASPIQMRARIEIWREDILRLWSRDGTSAGSVPPFGIAPQVSGPTLVRWSDSPLELKGGDFATLAEGLGSFLDVLGKRNAEALREEERRDGASGAADTKLHSEQSDS
jgi:hypothetical protein